MSAVREYPTMRDRFLTFSTSSAPVDYRMVGVNVVKGKQQWAYEIVLRGKTVHRSRFLWANPTSAMGAGERDVLSIIMQAIEERNQS